VRKLVRHVREPGRVRTILAFCLLHTTLFAFLYLVVVAPVVLLVTQQGLEAPAPRHGRISG